MKKNKQKVWKMFLFEKTPDSKIVVVIETLKNN